MLNGKKFTPELLEKAKSATDSTALSAFAQENDITLTAEEAATYFEQLHPELGALSDEEPDNVSGGYGGDNDNTVCVYGKKAALVAREGHESFYRCGRCGRTWKA